LINIKKHKNIKKKGFTFYTFIIKELYNNLSYDIFIYIYLILILEFNDSYKYNK